MGAVTTTVPTAVRVPVYEGYVRMLATHEDAKAEEIRQDISARIDDDMMVVLLLESMLSKG